MQQVYVFRESGRVSGGWFREGGEERDDQDVRLERETESRLPSAPAILCVSSSRSKASCTPDNGLVMRLKGMALSFLLAPNFKSMSSDLCLPAQPHFQDEWGMNKRRERGKLETLRTG